MTKRGKRGKSAKQAAVQEQLQPVCQPQRHLGPHDPDPDRLYSLAQAAKFFPSRCGHGVSLRTMHRWRTSGLIRCSSRVTAAGRKHWFIRGSEIIRRLYGDEPIIPPDPYPVRSPAQRTREYEAAVKRGRELGIVSTEKEGEA